MIAVLGDIHGSNNTLIHVLDEVKAFNDNVLNESKITRVIQVGDFGWYPDRIKYFEHINPEIPVEFIDGNHEDFRLLEGITEVTEMVPNIFYVPRGTVKEVDGRIIGYCGGAASVDKAVRLKNNWSWFPEEEITADDVRKFDGVDHVDLLITHTAPQFVIEKRFDAMNLFMWGLPTSWRDPSSVFVEELWKKFNKPQLICGHMHKSVCEGNIRILNINELIII